MENHFTTKINFCEHKKYHIVFYDTSGFKRYEDELDSKISEFNKDYKNIKHKIHVIFYVIDCDSVRILQRREKEIIENIFQINIPLFIVGQKGKITNMKNFIRKTKFELSTFPDEYNENIETLKKRIYCLDLTKKSVLDLLKSVYQELSLSEQFNKEILQTSSVLEDKDIINKITSENININQSKEEERVIQKILENSRRSIFFNDINEKLKEIKTKILKIKDKYINDKYFFKNLDLDKLNQEIENEFKNLFDDINKFNEIKEKIEEHQKEINIEGNNIFLYLKSIYTGTGLLSSGVVASSLFVTPFFSLLIVPIIALHYVLLNNRNDEVITNLKENFEYSYKKFEEKYILMNIYLIRIKAKVYNNAIDEFNEFIKEFESEGEVFI